MKTLISLSVLLFFFCFPGSDQEKEMALNYLKKISTQRDLVSTKNLEFVIHSVHQTDDAELEMIRQATVKQIDNSIRILDKTYSHAGDAKFRNITFELLKKYRVAYADDYLKALNLKKNKDKSVDDMKLYLEQVEKAETTVYECEMEYQKARDEFLKKYEVTDFNLTELEATIDKITRANEYYRELYLIYFKTTHLNSVFISSVNKKNYPVCVESRQNMITECDAMLTELEAFPAFEGEKGFLNSTVKVVKYFKNIAQKDYIQLEEIVKKQHNITSNDVGQMNNIRKAYLKSSKKVHETFFEEANTHLDTHIPKKLE